MRTRLLGLMVAVALMGGVFSPRAEAELGRQDLKGGWFLQSSAKVKDSGELISKVGYQTQGWYPTEVPATVLSALVANQVYPDPFYGKNLAQIPGKYPKPLDTSARPMTPDSPFAKPWWYRTEFIVPEQFKGQRVFLHFDGINFRAEVWLNGTKIGDKFLVAGPFRMFEFDVSELLRPGERNALAVKVFAPGQRDLSFTWVDWNPMPPDHNMGLWREVYLTTSGPVALRWPYVQTDLDLPSLAVAHLTVSAELVNATTQAIAGVLKGEIGEIKFEKRVELQPRETKEVIFRPEEFPVLNLREPVLWWPSLVGAQNLYQLDLSFETGGQVSDQTRLRFGIREITSELTREGSRLFKVNGQNILIRGAAWTPDLLLRHDPERMKFEIRYVKEMNLNAIRSEGKPEFDLLYDLTDESGIMVMAGWCCCDQWERWDRWDQEDYKVAEASLRDQIKRLRAHPSLFVWLNGSDNPPPPKVERMYLQVLSECRWPNPVVSSATEAATPVTGASGVKMNGPYEWIPPVYWYEDKKHGGAWNFNTEVSPGPAIPVIESLREFLPPEHLWPIDDYWNYHCGRGLFGNLRVYTAALNSRYGEAKSAEDFAMKSQAVAYEGERAMFEAFGRNKYLGTGVIQWMLNNAWPSMIWHLYDVYLRPGGGYFGTKKACEPLHVQFSYDDRSIVVVNSFYQEFKNLIVQARVFNLDLTEKFSREEKVSVGPDSSTRVFTLPQPPGLSTTYFLLLTLSDHEGKLVSENFYWLSLKPDLLNWPATQWHYTPTKQYADFTLLNTLPRVEVAVSARFENLNAEWGKAWITVENKGAALAFLTRVRIIKKTSGEDIRPIFFSDNYFPLWPGQKREISAEYPRKGVDSAGLAAAVDGWNVAPAVSP